MKRMLFLLTVAAFSLNAVSSMAAEPADAGAISSSDLASMGLGGLTPVSDVEGSKVRGMGNQVYGGSFAWGFVPFSLSFSQNGYTATGTTYSQGSNNSYAGLGVPLVGGVVAPIPFFGGFVTGHLGMAGGSSYASNN